MPMARSTRVFHIPMLGPNPKRSTFTPAVSGSPLARVKWWCTPNPRSIIIAQADMGMGMGMGTKNALEVSVSSPCTFGISVSASLSLCRRSTSLLPCYVLLSFVFALLVFACISALLQTPNSNNFLSQSTYIIRSHRRCLALAIAS